MRSLRTVRAMSISLALSLAAVAVTARDAVRCPAAPATVSGASTAEVEIVCEGARAAAEFLLQAGATVPSDLPIHVVPVLPEGVPRNAAACYATASGRVMLLRFESFERRQTWLGVPADRSLYRSVAAHEFAHAIARRQQGPRPLPRLAHEYLANVTMYATMEPALRERLLAAHPGTGYEHERQIGILDYVFDPALFGANAYRHWFAQRDRVGLLRRVFEGTAIVEMESD